MPIIKAQDAAAPLLIIELPDAAATTALGRRLAAILSAGDVLALVGDLGAGKTTLARGLIQALTPGETVASPTYTLVERYDAGSFEIAHFDLYRVEDESEIQELGIEEALSQDLVIIEWPERAPGVISDDALIIRLTNLGAARKAEIFGAPAWRTRLTHAGIKSKETDDDI